MVGYTYIVGVDFFDGGSRILAAGLSREEAEARRAAVTDCWPESQGWVDLDPANDANFVTEAR